MLQLELLGERLGLPGRIITKAGDNVTRLESVSIICRRLSESSKLLTIANEFGRSPAAISRIVKHVARLLYGMHKSTLYFNRRLIASRIGSYCSAVNENDAPLANVLSSILHAQLQGLNTVIATKIFSVRCTKDIRVDIASTGKHLRHLMVFFKAFIAPSKVADMTAQF
ncbi:hypothetical protein H257_13976 [Aphanomyces astaci]|uniref:Uncharacterized protein n=1 Tax=Aphanomyces astaci TaxID=112090 RepID=W4FUI7_APHAT|nr:hypothetical protein H257_13976 [Aphanomyces astaci]ETV70601.1 hypothetical protein H257_13976 [Aphanomyces astaci]|eukprot:XP_009839984.1 hypothetical protein H257_13976 [Aphanomyces astaci]